MSNNIPSGPKQQGSKENQSGAAGSNEAHGHNKPSEPGMTPGIGQAADRAEKEELTDQEKSDLEQQYKEAQTERD